MLSKGIQHIENALYYFIHIQFKTVTTKLKGLFLGSETITNQSKQSLSKEKLRDQ